MVEPREGWERPSVVTLVGRLRPLGVKRLRQGGVGACVRLGGAPPRDVEWSTAREGVGGCREGCGRKVIRGRETVLRNYSDPTSSGRRMSGPSPSHCVACTMVLVEVT